MSFTEWRKWLNELPWTLAWFVVLILIRPVVDGFYFLKEYSIFVSPLYVVGVLTPMLCIITINKVPKPNYSRLDTLMVFYAIIVSIASFFLLFTNSFEADAFENTIKGMQLIFLYFFCRRLIRSKRDLNGVLTTFAYSACIILLLLGYELIFNPIGVQVSRGLDRIHGHFADVFNYAIYASCGLLIAGYTYFDKSRQWSFTKRVAFFVVASAFSLVIIINIHHAASYVVLASLWILFFLNNLRTHITGGLFFIMTAGALIYMFGGSTIEEKILPLVETDIAVYEGEKATDKLLHGRVGRWKRYIDVFLELSVFGQFFGMSAESSEPYKYISKGAHNDYVRILMYTGYLGIFVHILFFFSIFRRSVKHSTPMRFLGLGVLAIFVLFSVTTTPSLYAPLLYVLVSVICMLALPPKMMQQ